MKSLPTIHLARRYRKNIIFAGIGIVCFVLFISAFQFSVHRTQELSHIREILTGRTYEINTIVKATADRISEINFFTKQYFSSEHMNDRHFLEDLFIESRTRDYFLLNYDNDTYSKDSGLIYGQGSFHNRADHFYEEVHAALHFLPLLKAAHETTPHLAWVYFFSKNRISTVYPGTDMDSFFKDINMSFSEFYNSVYQSEWWSRSLPDNNPGATPFWTSVYLDDAGKGLMVTYGIPVTVQGTYFGTVGGDITLDFLSTALRKSEYGDELFIILSDTNQVLGSSRHIAGESLQSLDDLLPGNLRSEDLDLTYGEELRHTTIWGYNMFSKGISEAPWSIIYILPEREIFKAILPSLSLYTAISICLLGILILGFRVIERNYVKPALALVAHIQSEASSDNSVMPKVPAFWQKWFSVVSSIFREKRELNDKLEEKVKEKTDELIKSQARLVQSEKLSAMGHMAGGLAHELNSPLAGLLPMIEKYRDNSESGTEEYKELTLMLKACNHMAKIVKDFGAFSRESADAMQPQNLNEVIEDTLSFSSGQLIKKGIKLEKDFDENLPKAMGEKTELQQVILNIMNNAYDATPNKGTLVVKTSHSEKSVIMEITDSGPGIRNEDIHKIFDPFYTTKKAGEGTGLGLSVSYGIIKKHNGVISVKSEPGKWTTFFISLPRV